MSKHDPMVRLKHMHGFAKKAVELAGNRTHADILNDEVLMLAITHLIELVGEAASWISEEDRGKYPTIPWKKVVGMRNRLIHGYDYIDSEILYGVITVDLPELIAKLDVIIAVK
jgi:uncharacterized protein with HEPN domain